MATTHWVTDGHLGVDLEQTHSDAKHSLREVADGNNASRWMYVVASAAITQYALVGIETSGTADMMTSTMSRSTTDYQFGIAQVAFGAGEYGWVALEGQTLTVLTTAATTAGNRLYTTDTAGRVSGAIATASNVQVGGLIHTVTTGATASSSPCVARNLVAIWPQLAVT